eukprot:gene3153-3606_t
MEFLSWMERIMDRLDMLSNHIDDLQKKRNSIDGEELLDNQDLLQMLKISNRSLQRYRSIGKLPYYTISGKLYYKLSDVHQFIRESFNPPTVPMSATSGYAEAPEQVAQEIPEQLSDVLLVLDKEKMKIQAVKGIDKDGNLETVDPTKKNQSDFLRVDKHGDFISNFFSNFWRQLKNPTPFAFFKVDANEAVEKAKQFQKQVDTPTPEGKKEMEKHEEKSEYRFQPEQVDWQTMNNFGVSKEYLEKRNLLEPLLKGYKTPELLNVSVNFGGVAVRTDARLQLRNNENGETVVMVHGVRNAPELNREFFGHKFTDEDKKNLLETGNMGRIVDLKYKTGNTIPSIIQVDKLTNELVSVPSSFIRVPDKIGDRELTEAEKQTVQEGKPLRLEGLISEKGTPYNAQNNQQSQEPNPLTEFRGKELNEEQRNKLKDGQSVFIELIDKKNQPYNGYITLNKQTDKLFFEFPDKYKERVQASEAHKTQTEVNSKGKTNEATKNINEPLQKGATE